MGKIGSARFPHGLRRLPLGMLAATLAVSGGAFAAVFGYEGGALTGCTIKGNISIETGERIYHMPGQEYYSSTRISAGHGERWFCSERDARAAGWRRSRV